MMHLKQKLLKTPLTIIFICFFTNSFSQINVTKLNKNSIPKSIKYAGHIVDAVRYTDKDGEQVVITTETGELESKTGYNVSDRDAYIYAYHYNLNGDSVNLTWRVYDFVKECDLDITANFIKNTFAVTDLDNDGHAEVWMVYRTICRGDISPSSMKIIMYQAGKKYAVRGTRKVVISAKEVYGGKYTMDAAFTTAPESFKAYAIKLWNNNLSETF